MDIVYSICLRGLAHIPATEQDQIRIKLLITTHILIILFILLIAIGITHLKHRQIPQART